MERLDSLSIEIHGGAAVVTVNGEDISKEGKYLNLTFENGEWSLMVTKDNIYSTGDQNDYVREPYGIKLIPRQGRGINQLQQRGF